MSVAALPLIFHFKIIDRNILLLQPDGSADLEGLKKGLNLAKLIIEEHFNNKPFICIEDFTKVVSPTTESRKYYIQFMKDLINLKAIVFHSINPLIKLSLKLAEKLNFFKFDIYVSNNYYEAVNLALKNSDFKYNEIQLKKEPVWDLKFSDYAVRYEIIDNNIIHVVSEGLFGAEHIDTVIKYQNNFIKKNFHNKIGEYYYVVDLSNVSITRDCRRKYADEIQSLYKLFPFKSYIYYGADRMTDMIATFLAPFINFNIKKAKDLIGVLEIVKTDSTKSNKKQRKKISEETQNYIDEFLVFLAKINWESYGIDKKFKKDSTHPFYQVYDAITLIKSDLDELYLEKKKNEEERAILQHKLQQSLKLETMGKLAGSVAHDLNNVLSGIVSYPDIIMKSLPDNKENAKALKYIKRMKKSGKKAADIVQDLLTLSRSGVVSFEPVDFNSIIEEYLKSPEFKKLISDKPRISVECNLSENLYILSASSIHLTKTIMNLITNAIEAIPEHGAVKIKTNNISFNNKQLKGYNKKADGNYIELIISDTGVGISEQDQLKIFEPFYSKKVIGRSGTGLGMMVIKGTVDDHNGFILINSKENKGTEFILYFPVDEDRASIKRINKIDNYTGKGESVLIIDDDEDQRIIASKILSDLYYNVNTCSSGEEAVEYLKKEQTDILILDMIMTPGIDGLETFKQIKKIYQDQKAIIVSGYTTTKNVIEAQKLGAGKYIRKPYTVKEIGIAVFEELNK